MKTTIKKRTYQAVYRLLNYITPLNTDCGALCGAACCTSDEEDMIIYLLPGEEKLFTRKEEWLNWDFDYAEDYDFPESWHGKVYYVHCKTAPSCPREMRPLQCRFFPLAPHLTEEGVLRLIRYPDDLPYACPLLEPDVRLEPRVVKAVHTVWKHLIRDPLIYDLVEYDSSDRNEENLDFVY
ncbi:MAG: hypothetical protein IKT15_01675 [Firmicutes bacterium]|nr:hypothetical protein [Bacillota bacterium]